MKVSKITQGVILNHLREEEENLDYEDLNLLDVMKEASVEFCKSQTGLSDKELDEHEDIAIAVLTLISDMWDNRSMTVQKNNVNTIVDAILGMHRTNLIPTPDWRWSNERWSVYAENCNRKINT